MFDFVDLFAGVGGFHAALAGLGGRGVQAAEIDPHAARVYKRNWGLTPVSDVRDLAADPDQVEDHAVLTAGFPCQPFSKSGRQLGMAEDRGTLFHDIVRILEAKKPPVVMLENVRNLAGPRQKASWAAVVDGLRRVGYQVSSTPLVFSPHLLPPEAGGAAQLRERLYILGHYVGPDAVVDDDVTPVVDNRPQLGWHPSRWRVEDHVLLPSQGSQSRTRYDLDREEVVWVETWNKLLALLGPRVHLPGHPLWEQEWRPRRTTLAGLPDWKQALVRKNHDLYLQHRVAIDAWRASNPALKAFPNSRRKLEWQAGQGDGVKPRDLWAQLLHFRPSGIRAKQPTYAPTLVAMNQASVFGPLRRRLTPLEAARLQGFDSSFTFGDQVDSLSYKQMGNAVNVGAARYVLDNYVRAHDEVIAGIDHRGAALVSSVLSATAEDVREVAVASA